MPDGNSSSPDPRHLPLATGTGKSNAVGVAPQAAKVKVGLNYPWAWDKIGIYFGSGNFAPGDDPRMDAWIPNLRRNLAVIQDMGVQVVRIMLHGNMHNFGAISRAIDASLGIQDPADWEFQPPLVYSAKYTDQVQQMLQEFKNRNMRVIPSFLDFSAVCDSADAESNGNRSQMVRDRKVGTTVLKMSLDALLAVSVPFASTIEAWEVMNEPSNAMLEFVPKELGGWGFTARALPLKALSTFLQDAIDLIEARDVFKSKSTVGHRFLSDTATMPAGSVKQFHFYPQSISAPKVGGVSIGESVLPTFAESGAIVGEFATKTWNGGFGALWSEIPAEQQQDPRDRVLARLNKLQEKGYKVALAWPDRGDPGITFDDKDPTKEELKFSKPVQDAIREYLSK